MKFRIIILILSTSFLEPQVDSHGMLLEPPNRSSLWRFDEFKKYYPPINYSDNQLYCGGFDNQYVVHGGKCGACGDDYGQPRPRDNETGGKYGKGIIARNYTSGQVVPIVVDITADHFGTFQFTLCARNTPFLEDEDCFKYLLPFADGTGYAKEVTSTDLKAGYVNTTLTLPPDIRCKYCILRWNYRTGNNWGICANGTTGLGCGNQEIFRGCADVVIG